MKVLPFIIPKPDKTHLILQEDKGAYFYDKLHQHEEIQLSCILKGDGRFYIGDCLGHFQSGDVFIIGENLPHVFYNDPRPGGVQMLSLFFTRNAYGNDFFKASELKSIRSLIQSAEPGIKIVSDTEMVKIELIKMASQKPFEQLITFLRLLDQLDQSEKETLSSVVHSRKFREKEGKRMRDIMDYTFANFELNLSIGTIAEVANMTPNAFCKYFKQRTGKTYVHFLLEIRIAKACRLLLRNRDLTISEVAYRSGFNNQTNFNRKFKEFKGMTPSNYSRNFD